MILAGFAQAGAACSPSTLASQTAVSQLASSLTLAPGAQSVPAGNGVEARFARSGLVELIWNGAPLLSGADSGEIRPVNGTPILAGGRGGTAVDAQPQSERFNLRTRTLYQTYRWGMIRCVYRREGDRLILDGAVSANPGGSGIQQITLQLAELTFPATPMGNIPDPGQFGLGAPHPLQQFPLRARANIMPPLIEVDFGPGVLVVCDDISFPSSELIVPHSSNVPTNTRYPFWASLGPTPAGGSRSFEISFRFGAEGSKGQSLAADVYKRFAYHHPFRLQWIDRRPIGTNFLASAGAHPTRNRAGWFNNAPDIDTTTPKGREGFRVRLLRYADESLQVLRSMHAQGMITWDPEGQEFDRSTYYGDPRLVSVLAPEMETPGPDGLPAVDEYFKRFRDAGFRVGVCVRPQQIRFVNGAPVQEDSPDPARTLADKIACARRRWGCTLFYIDSTVKHEQPLDASIFEKVAAANPGVLLIPENQTFRDYAVTAPLDSFFHHGVTGTSADVRAAYPGAFTVLLGPGGGPGGTIAGHREALSSALKQGDILTFRGWFDDAENAPIRKLYETVGQGPSVDIAAPRPGAPYAPGATVRVLARVTPGDSPVRSVECFAIRADGTQVSPGRLRHPPYVWLWRKVPAGRYLLSVRVTDALGHVRVPATRDVVVGTGRVRYLSSSRWQISHRVERSTCGRPKR